MDLSKQNRFDDPAFEAIKNLFPVLQSLDARNPGALGDLARGLSRGGRWAASAVVRVYMGAGHEKNYGLPVFDVFDAWGDWDSLQRDGFRALLARR